MRLLLLTLILSSYLLNTTLLPHASAEAAAWQSSTATQYIREYDIRRDNSVPRPITVAPNGTVWFVETNASRIAKLDPSSGNITEFPFCNSTTYTYPLNETKYVNSLAADPQGNLWFTLGHANAIGRFNVTDLVFTYWNITELSTSQEPSVPFGITIDFNGIVWVTEWGTSRIGRLDPTNNPPFREYTLQHPNETPYEIFVDHNQFLWITSIWYTSGISPQQSGSTLTRFDPSNGDMKLFELSPWGVFAPVGVAVDSSGHAWVGDHGGSWLVEVDTSTGAVKLHRASLPPLVPNAQNLTDRVYNGATFSLVNDVVLGIDGTPWFIEHVGARVGHYIPSTNTMIEYDIPTLYPTTLWLAADQTGGIWFTEESGNKIGYLDTRNADPRFSVTPTTILATLFPGASTTFSITVTNTSPDPLSIAAGVENTYSFTGPLTNLTLRPGETRTIEVRVDSSPYLSAGDYATGGLASLAPIIKVSDGNVNYPIAVLLVVSDSSFFNWSLWLYITLATVVATATGTALVYNRKRKSAA